MGGVAGNGVEIAGEHHRQRGICDRFDRFDRLRPLRGEGLYHLEMRGGEAERAAKDGDVDRCPAGLADRWRTDLPLVLLPVTFGVYLLTIEAGDGG